MEIPKYIKGLKGNLSVLIIVIVSIMAMVVDFEYSYWLKEGKVIRNDVKTYYTYLPATIIYGDLSLSFIKDNPELKDKIWPVITKDGKKLLITSYGLSLLYSPFFLLAHAYSLVGSFEANGYSMPYRFMLVFSSLFYFVLGLVFLRKLLNIYFQKDFLVAFVLLAIGLGTNLFYYVTEEPAMVHSYNFCLISIFAYLSIKWHQKPGYINSIVLGFLLGLIVLVRPTNILVLLFFVLWGITSWKEFGDRILFFLKRIDLVLIMLFFFFLLWIPQFLYWKFITDQYVYYSYGVKNGSFFWHNPQIVNILISYKKGWFVYTPIMAIAFAGIFFLIKRLKIAFWAVLIYMIAMIYVSSSWWSWWYGGGFSIRAFVDTYAIMAIPLAAILDVSTKKKWIGAVFFFLIGVLIWYNTFQMRQKHYGAIHWFWMNKEAYWETFLKLKPTTKYWSLIKVPDSDLARKGIYEAVTPETLKHRKKIRQLIKNYEYTLRKDTGLMKNLNEMAVNEAELDTLVSRYARENLDKYLYKIFKSEIDSVATLLQHQTNSDKEENKADSIIIQKAIDVFRRDL